MSIDVTIQIVACALTTICSIGAIAVAVWTVWESQRPQPMVFLEYEKDKAFTRVVVQNFGSGVARDLKILGFDYDQLAGETYKGYGHESFIEKGIPLLVPGARRETIILADCDAANHEEESCVVTLKYKEGFLGPGQYRHDRCICDGDSLWGR